MKKTFCYTCVTEHFSYVMARNRGKMGFGRDEMLVVSGAWVHLKSTPNSLYKPTFLVYRDCVSRNVK